MALTTLQIARRYMAAIVKDALLQTWVNTTFSRGFALHIGVDPRRRPTDMDAPFIAIFLDALESGNQKASNVHTLGTVVGIEDAEFVTRYQWQEMRGMVRLSDELMPDLEKCLRFAIPNATMQTFNVEYFDLNFPTLQANIEITVTESLPIGRRDC
jgi:hypothetical protein